MSQAFWAIIRLLPTVVEAPVAPGAKPPANLLEFFLIGFPFKTQSPGQSKGLLIMAG
ncbi:MAG: hypothetical protein JXA79_13950 [Deltaproteobacteria bacterium]|nr:hypothetical protein [Deltaproteobacteria bacterium]